MRTVTDSAYCIHYWRRAFLDSDESWSNHLWFRSQSLAFAVFIVVVRTDRAQCLWIDAVIRRCRVQCRFELVADAIISNTHLPKRSVPIAPIVFTKLSFACYHPKTWLTFLHQVTNPNSANFMNGLGSESWPVDHVCDAFVWEKYFRLG